VATESDAARERVLAARNDVAIEVERLQASARAAVDIPAKVRENPLRVAAAAGGVGFVALGGPRRVFRRVRSAIFGPPAPMPEAMLPEEIEKVLKRLGDDGDHVRGVLERDFADYVKAAEKRRGPQIRQSLYYSFSVPLMRRAAKLGVDWLLQPDEHGFAAQLERLRQRDPQSQRPPAGPPLRTDGEGKGVG